MLANNCKQVKYTPKRNQYFLPTQTFKEPDLYDRPHKTCQIKSACLSNLTRNVRTILQRLVLHVGNTLIFKPVNKITDMLIHTHNSIAN